MIIDCGLLLVVSSGHNKNYATFMQLQILNIDFYCGSILLKNKRYFSQKWKVRRLSQKIIKSGSGYK